MSVVLEIEDGDPWWMSPDVWTVPGADPNGSPGSPVVGISCYLWAKVRNTGSDSVSNATVRFYWANPAVGFDRTTANLVGTSFVTLGAGQVSDVLCLTPWTPVYVNGGHECILAEAFHSSLDPLPAAPDFNVPTDRHVAQRNLSVVSAFAGTAFSLAFEVHNRSRKAGRFRISAREGKLAQVEALAPALGRGFQLPRKPGRVQSLGFVEAACPDAKATGATSPSIDGIELRPHGRTGYSLVGRLEGPAALVHVTQERDGRVVGGLSALILEAREEKR